MSQTQIFMETEGDRWLERNRDKLGKVDPVTDSISELGISPKAVCEVGCANGWRLARLRDRFGSTVIGVDPSKKAVNEAIQTFGVTARWGSAESLPAMTAWCDLLIYGFCLYLTEPRDWMRIAAEGDRVLAYNGHLVVYDFNAGDTPWMVDYTHAPGVTSYHFDFANLWLANPMYSVKRRLPLGENMVTILQKKKLIPTPMKW